MAVYPIVARLTVPAELLTVHAFGTLDAAATPPTVEAAAVAVHDATAVVDIARADVVPTPVDAAATAQTPHAERGA